MVDYAEKLLAIAKSGKAIALAFIRRDKKSIVDEINNLIIHAIELKQWVLKHYEDNKYTQLATSNCGDG